MAPCTRLSPFVFCHYSTVSPFCHVTSRPCHQIIILFCHLPHRATCYQHAATVSTCHLVLHRNTTVPPATNMPQPCRRVTWCSPVPPPCHWVTLFATVAPVFHLVSHHDTAVPPCSRVAAILTRHSIIPPYAYLPCIINHAIDSCQSYLRSFWHCLT